MTWTYAGARYLAKWVRSLILHAPFQRARDDEVIGPGIRPNAQSLSAMCGIASSQTTRSTRSRRRAALTSRLRWGDLTWPLSSTSARAGWWAGYVRFHDRPARHGSLIMAIWRRSGAGGRPHHSNHDSQYTSEQLQRLKVRRQG